MFISVDAKHGKVISALAAFVLSGVIACAGCKRATLTSPASVSEAVDPWKEAVAKVEEDRREAVGREAAVEVPRQLEHYADRRRFLAVQAADSRAHADALCRDFADVVSLIHRGQLVEMKPLGADYILYGVGHSVSNDPFAHYDAKTRQDIPIAVTEDQRKEEVSRAEEAVKESVARLARLENELRRAQRRNRIRRAALLKEVSRARAALSYAKLRSKLLASSYADPAQRKSMQAEYQLLADVAGSFEGETYDLNDSDSRRGLKIRLLSFIRPEARDTLFQIARAYKEKFDRPLPVSSLVRPVQYQHELAESNANVARGSTTPHSTGFAFDLYYRYMSAAEQEWLMSVIALLEDEGRVEALRESRDNIHVYVFENGRRPDEKVIARIIAEKRPPRPGKKSRAASRAGKKFRVASRR